jgi:hypothetical protein
LIVYLDGLERSGNVYLSYAIGVSTGIELKSLRTHDVKTLQEYNDHWPFIVPVRDAIPSIVSAKIFRDYVHENGLFGDKDELESNLDRIISRFEEYTNYLNITNKFFIAPFDEFIKDHNMVLDKIIKFYDDPRFQVVQRCTKEELFDHIKKWGNDEYSHHPQLGNFPRENNTDKLKIESLLIEKYAERIESIQNQINRLYSRYYAI